MVFVMRFLTVFAAAVLCTLSVVPATAQPEARIETSMGTIVVLLDNEKAPKTVANFIRYAKAGHFNGTVFYRIVPGFVIQAGSMGADGKWRPLNKPIPLETATGLSNKRGTIAMARDAKPATAQAEFFINLADTNALGLDAKPTDAPNTTGYAAFGMVTEGMEVVDAISKVELGGGKGGFPDAYPKKAIIIKKVTIGEAVPPPEPPPEPVADAPATTPVDAPANAPAGDPAVQPDAAPAAVPDIPAPAGDQTGH